MESESKNFTIVIGDVHGNYNALCDILQRAGAMDENEERLPGFHIISVGDVVNCAPRGVQYRGFYPDDYKTLSHVYELKLIDEICVGNHEIFYTHDRESGRFAGMAYAAHEMHPELEPLMKQMVAEGTYKAATTAHGWLITHAGVAPNYQAYPQTGNARNWTVDEWASALNRMLADDTRGYDLIDTAGWSVGGMGVGGIVWFRPDDLIVYRYGSHEYDMVDNRVPQIVGHTIDEQNPQFMEDWNMWYIDSGKYMEGIGSGIIWNGDSWEPIADSKEAGEAGDS